MGLRLFAVLALASLPALAGIVQFSGQPRYVSINNYSVPVYPEALTMAPPTGPATDGYKLALTGFGIYVKKIAFIKVNVYVAAHYIEVGHSMLAADPLKSVVESPAEVIQMTLGRSVSADETVSAFEDGLTTNHVDLDSPAIRHILEEIDFDTAPQDNVTILTLPGSGGSESVTIETRAKTIFAEQENLGLDMWRIWFGIPMDWGIAQLKPKLIGAKPPFGLNGN